MKKKILVAESEKKIRALVRMYLEKHDYIVITAKDGKEALSLIMKHEPDLIVLDVLMPKMNGLEVCIALRESNQYTKIPIIYLSSLIDKQSIISGLELGADDYVTKPFDPNELIARINAVLRRTKYKGDANSEQLSDMYEELTYQETKIMKLMEKGFTNKEIALKLSLTEGTIKVYNHNIYQKLQVKNRTQAIVRAKEMLII